MCNYSISFFKIHFSRYVNCIGFTDIRYLFQILFHYSNQMLLQVAFNMNQIQSTYPEKWILKKKIEYMLRMQFLIWLFVIVIFLVYQIEYIIYYI